MQTKNSAALLEEKGIRPSHQRVRIYEVLKSTTSHPTVDWLYSSLINELPTLSRTTVYNTLKLFIDAGIARAIFIDGGEVHYDADMSPQGHFLCRKCGGVFDIELPALANSPLLPTGFALEQVQFNCTGLCGACAGAAHPAAGLAAHHATE